MKHPLKGCIIATTGNFGEGKSQANLERWIVANGGNYANTIGPDVTHLICSSEDWKKKVPKGKLISFRCQVAHAEATSAIVKQAALTKTVVLDYNWLEDSLQNGRVKKATPYLMSGIEKAKRQREMLKFKSQRSSDDQSKTSIRHQILACLHSLTERPFLKGCNKTVNELCGGS